MTARRVIVLLDDTRDFRDGPATHTVRSSRDALTLLPTLEHIDELWLDYDLIGDDTADPVVEYLLALAGARTPLPVADIRVHSSNIVQGHRITAELAAAGYPARRSFAVIFVRAPLPAGLVERNRR